MCKRLPNNTILLHRYRNPSGHHYPDAVGDEDGGVLSLGQQIYSNGAITCQFTLSNFTIQRSPQLNALTPLSQSGAYYPLFAIGSLDEDCK